MITLTRVKQATSEFIKVLRYGKSDVQTSYNALPHGIDSKPVKNKIAIHATTGNKSESVILGYIDKSDNTSEGELRLYATDSTGTEVFSMLFKNDGTVEFGGNTDYMIRYNALNTALQSFVNNLNKKLTTALEGIPYTWPGVSVDISGAKIEEIKTM